MTRWGIAFVLGVVLVGSACGGKDKPPMTPDTENPLLDVDASTPPDVPSPTPAGGAVAPGAK